MAGGMKTLADGRITLWALTTKPKDMKAPTVAEIKAGKKISCRISKQGYRLGATGNEEISEQELCKKGAGTAPGKAQFGGGVIVFRYLDEAGMAVIEDDYAWDLLKKTGTQIWLVERVNQEESADPAQDQEVRTYEILTGTPKPPSEPTNGYIKMEIDFYVQDAEILAKIAAG